MTRQQCRRRRAFSLVLAVVLTGMIGMTLTVIVRTAHQAFVAGHMDELDIRCTQVLISAKAWAARNAGELRALAPDAVRDLDVTGLLPPECQGRLQFQVRADGRSVDIRARVARGRWVAAAQAVHDFDSE